MLNNRLLNALGFILVFSSQMSSSDRALINAFREISNMADKINLPKTIVDRANVLFKQVSGGAGQEASEGDSWPEGHAVGI